LGTAGLADQSRRPHRSPAALDPVLLQRLLEAHDRHPYWGPRKLLRLVSQRWPHAPWPVRSTVARCFQHLGLVTARRRVRRPGAAGPPRAEMEAPNAIWTTDYKGQFRLGDGQYCFPLTVADGYSRLLLACQALTSTKLGEARPVFERLCREYGLPRRIRSDDAACSAGNACQRCSSRKHIVEQPPAPYKRRPARRTCGPENTVKSLWKPYPSPTLTVPTHVALHTPLRVLQLRPAIRARS
jgi:putative transposase